MLFDSIQLINYCVHFIIYSGAECDEISISFYKITKNITITIDANLSYSLKPIYAPDRYYFLQLNDAGVFRSIHNNNHCLLFVIVRETYAAQHEQLTQIASHSLLIWVKFKLCCFALILSLFRHDVKTVCMDVEKFVIEQKSCQKRYRDGGWWWKWDGKGQSETNREKRKRERDRKAKWEELEREASEKWEKISN